MKEQSLFMKTVGKLESAVRWIVVVLLIIMVVDIITAVFLGMSFKIQFSGQRN